MTSARAGQAQVNGVVSSFRIGLVTGPVRR
jgi:hypothetical protein